MCGSKVLALCLCMHVTLADAVACKIRYCSGLFLHYAIVALHAADEDAVPKSKPAAKVVMEQMESDFVKTSFGASASVTVKVKEGILDETQPTAMDELLTSYNADRRKKNREKANQSHKSAHQATKVNTSKKGRGRAGNKRRRGKAKGSKPNKHSHGGKKKARKR